MYQSLEAELHDAFWEAEGPAAELPLLRSFLRKHQGRNLELGCGSGRLLLPLLAEGFDIEGLDNAPEMLALCESHAQEKNLIPTLHSRDLFALPLDKPFDAIAIPAFTLQLLPDPISAVARMFELLVEGGGLYFSVFYPWAEIEEELPTGEFYPDHSVTLPNGQTATITTKHELDRAQQILTRTHRYELSEDGIARKHESTQEIRYCLEEDWEHLLDATGFVLDKTFSDFEPEATHSEETAGISTFIARKKSHEVE